MIFIYVFLHGFDFLVASHDLVSCFLNRLWLKREKRGTKRRNLKLLIW